MGMSLSTLDRRITAGRLMVRREPYCERCRMYLVVDDDAMATNGSINAWVAIASGIAHLAVARERIRGLEDRVEVPREQL